MSEQSSPRARVALVGPTSLIGREVREQLAAAGCPGELIELLDVDDEVGVLTDYGDEAHVILKAAEDRLRDASLACFCGDPEAARRLAPAALQEGGAVIDCTSAFADDPAALLAGDPTDIGAGGLIVVAEAATLVLRDLVSALGGSADAAATVVLPASVGDDAAPEELARQATALLNFSESDDDGPGRRQAFDAVPASAALTARIRSQLGALDAQPPRLSCLRASVFHGLTVSLLLPAASAADVVQRLTAAGLEIGRAGDDGATIDSPGRASGSSGIFVATVTDDPAGGCWVWAVADNHHVTARAAAAAIMARLVPTEPASD